MRASDRATVSWRDGRCPVRQFGTTPRSSLQGNRLARPLLSFVQAPIVFLISDLRIGWNWRTATFVDKSQRASFSFEIVLIPIENLGQLHCLAFRRIRYSFLRVDAVFCEFLELGVELVTLKRFAIQWRTASAGAVESAMDPGLAQF